MKIRVQAASSEKQHIAGLGSVVPGKWTGISEKQIQRFELLNGHSIKEDPGIEIQKETKKKEKE